MDALPTLAILSVFTVKLPPLRKKRIYETFKASEFLFFAVKERRKFSNERTPKVKKKKKRHIF